ncbi:MAG: hypothetical protein AAF502_24285 [Bacteroidota bacterium]
MFERNIPEDDLSNEDYLGNIWGWKFSIFSLFFILLFVGWLVYSHYYREMPESETETPIEETIR